MEKEIREPANSVGKIYFGKWFLNSTTDKMDKWKKKVVDPTDYRKYHLHDSYILITRNNINYSIANCIYNIYFSSDLHFLEEHFKSFYPEYSSYDSELHFNDIQDAKDRIDKFLQRLDNLKAFI